MREVKVRAWDTRANTWVEGIDLIIHTSGKLLRIPEHIILTWSTGLIDKHGKEIWEGDILYHDDVSLWPKTVRKTTAKRIARYPKVPLEVSWNRERAGFDPFVSANDDLGPYFYAERIEVVGNIYENPELLEVK